MEHDRDRKKSYPSTSLFSWQWNDGESYEFNVRVETKRGKLMDLIEQDQGFIF